METEVIILLILLAFVCEFIDSSMGMMYGTLLSPLLIILGFDPLVVIPSILLSQAFGGFIASIFHNKFANADFKPKTYSLARVVSSCRKVGIVKSVKKFLPKDTKIALAISGLGIIATIFAVLAAISIPKWLLQTYIGILVVVIGIILLSKIEFKFSWKKIIGIGILSSINKGLSGGGFGPVVTSGQVIAGNTPKASIASTTLAEAPICLIGFITYYLAKGFTDWEFLFVLALGAMAAAPFGALLTSKVDEAKFKPILGVLSLVLGIWMLIKVIQ